MRVDRAIAIGPDYRHAAYRHDERHRSIGCGASHGNGVRHTQRHAPTYQTVLRCPPAFNTLGSLLCAKRVSNIMGGSARALVAYPEQLSGMLLETIPEAMVLSDSDGRIVMLNSNSEKLFGYDRGELVGKKVEVLVPARFRARHRRFHGRYNANPTVRSMAAGIPLFGRRKDGTEFPAEIVLGPVQIGDKRFVWSAVRDVTERELLITKLRAALDEVNALRGLLSICASCKRIRDEHGAWQQLESYIQSHSEAKFTHGLCADCIRKLYPDFQPEKG